MNWQHWPSLGNLRKTAHPRFFAPSQNHWIWFPGVWGLGLLCKHLQKMVLRLSLRSLILFSFSSWGLLVRALLVGDIIMKGTQTSSAMFRGFPCTNYLYPRLCGDFHGSWLRNGKFPRVGATWDGALARRTGTCVILCSDIAGALRGNLWPGLGNVNVTGICALAPRRWESLLRSCCLCRADGGRSLQEKLFQPWRIHSVCDPWTFHISGGKMGALFGRLRMDVPWCKLLMDEPKAGLNSKRSLGLLAWPVVGLWSLCGACLWLLPTRVSCSPYLSSFTCELIIVLGPVYPHSELPFQGNVVLPWERGS